MANYNQSYILELTQNGHFIAFNRNSQNQFVKIDILNTSNVTNAANDDYSFVGSDNGKAMLKVFVTRNKSNTLSASDIELDFAVYTVYSESGTEPFYIEYALTKDFSIGSYMGSTPDFTDWVVLMVTNASPATSIKIRITENNPTPILQWTSGITPTIETNV